MPAAAPTTPRVIGLMLTARTFALGSKLPVVSRAPKTPVGTKIRFTLSEQATVTLTFQRTLTGRLVDKKCIPATARLRKYKACARYVRAGTYTFTDEAGPCTVQFEGVLPKRHKLAPGRYRLTVTATNAAERRSAPATAAFTLRAAPKRS